MGLNQELKELEKATRKFLTATSGELQKADRLIADSADAFRTLLGNRSFLDCLRYNTTSEVGIPRVVTLDAKEFAFIFTAIESFYELQGKTISDIVKESRDPYEMEDDYDDYVFD